MHLPLITDLRGSHRTSGKVSTGKFRCRYSARDFLHDPREGNHSSATWGWRPSEAAMTKSWVWSWFRISSVRGQQVERLKIRQVRDLKRKKKWGIQKGKRTTTITKQYLNILHKSTGWPRAVQKHIQLNRPKTKDPMEL